MFHRKFGRTYRLLAICCLLGITLSLRAEDVVRYRARALGNKVLIEGSSNIHDWTMDGQIIGGWLHVPEAVVLDSAQAAVQGVTGGKVNAKADVFIPVTSIKNSQHEGMSEAMEDAMKAKDFPHIEFHLIDMTLKEPHAAGTPLEFMTKGDLMVAGVTNQISMPVRIESLDSTKLKVTGTMPLKMTDFKIKPPVKVGLFRTYDDVKISFEWVVGKPAKPKAP